MRGIVFSSVFCGLWAGPLVADALTGSRNLSLIEGDGTAHRVGQVRFAAQGGTVGYTLELDDDAFADHFLSMRPFQCLEGAQKHWCHVPYPYAIRRQVSPGDLTDLEYDLLFLWKGATEYGINMWNGVYYRLEIDGDRIVGVLSEMDMDTLSAPPPEGELRPLDPGDLHEADPDSHWLPRLVIE